MSAGKVKRQTQLFMTRGDEEAFSNRLRQTIPGVRFIDGDTWHSSTPPLVPRIDQGKANRVYIWNPALVVELPVLRRADGRIDGPMSGVVIAFYRSGLEEEEEEMRSGRMAVGIDDARADLKEFARIVWRDFYRSSQAVLITVAGEPVPEYRIGPDALNWVLASPNRRLRDQASTTAYFVPRTSTRNGSL